MSRALVAVASLVVAASAVVAACSTADPDARVAAGQPDKAGFVGVRVPGSSRQNVVGVGEVLVARCGSLDCHGAANRNMRLYGLNGARLSKQCDPAYQQARDDGGTPLVAADGGPSLVELPSVPITTPDRCGYSTIAELEADYEAVIALEPTVMSDVVAKRADPGMLTVVRKARGDEQHKGGKRITPGDAADRCLLGWLRGAPDSASCQAALNAP